MSELEKETQLAPTEIDLVDVDQAVIDAVTPQTRELIARCLAGTEALQRPLKVNESQKLSPRAIQAIFLRIAGFKGNEVAEMMDLTPAHVSNLFNHPYSRKIFYAITGDRTGTVVDIRSRMEYHAGVLLEHIAQKAAQEDDLAKVSQVTFGLLDRAGYSPKQQMQVDTRRLNINATLDNATASKLTDALNESQSVDAKIMPTYTPKAPPEQVVSPETVDDRAIAALRKVV